VARVLQVAAQGWPVWWGSGLGREPVWSRSGCCTRDNWFFWKETTKNILVLWVRHVLKKAWSWMSSKCSSLYSKITIEQIRILYLILTLQEDLKQFYFVQVLKIKCQCKIKKGKHQLNSNQVKKVFMLPLLQV
jgi:hypothetical protein